MNGRLQRTSQSYQANYIDAVMNRIEPTNRQYVEFGFNQNSQCSGSGANTCALWKNGWSGLLLDGGAPIQPLCSLQSVLPPTGIGLVLFCETLGD